MKFYRIQSRKNTIVNVVIVTYIPRSIDRVNKGYTYSLTDVVTVT